MGLVSVVKLAIIGFMSGLLNAGFGLGSTFIVNPNLIKFDLPPLVASGTGIYMTFLNNLSSTIANIFYKRLNL